MSNRVGCRPALSSNLPALTAPQTADDLVDRSLLAVFVVEAPGVNSRHVPALGAFRLDGEVAEVTSQAQHVRYRGSASIAV